MGFTDEAIAKLNGAFFGPDNISTIGYSEVIQTCSDFVGAADKHAINVGNVSAILSQISKGQSFTAGAEWTLRYIGSHGDEFAGKTLNFEVIEDVGGKIRRVDLKVKDGDTNIFYEFKSVKTLPPQNFLTQIGKDLANKDVSSLSQIRWIFDGRKVTQEELTTAVKKALDEWVVPKEVLDNWDYTGERAKLFKKEVLYKHNSYLEIFKTY